MSTLSWLPFAFSFFSQICPQFLIHRIIKYINWKGLYGISSSTPAHCRNSLIHSWKFTTIPGRLFQFTYSFRSFPLKFSLNLLFVILVLVLPSLSPYIMSFLLHATVFCNFFPQKSVLQTKHAQLLIELGFQTPPLLSL